MMATSPPTGSKFRKRKISRLPGKDEFLHSEITKFVGTRKDRSTAPIGLPEAVPLVQYGEQLRDAATAVKASHPASPPQSIAVAEPANARAQPASLVETQPSPMNLNTENLELPTTDEEPSLASPAPVVEGEIEDCVKDQVEEQVEDEAVEDQVRDEVEEDVEDEAEVEARGEFEREVEHKFEQRVGDEAPAPAPATVTAQVAPAPESEPAPPIVAAGPFLVREITLPSLSTLADNIKKPTRVGEVSSTSSSSTAEAASQEMEPAQEESSVGRSVGEGASHAPPQAEEQARKGSGLKLTFALKVDAEGLSGDVERYAGTSWGATSLTSAETNEKHVERLPVGEAEPLVRGVVQLSPNSPEMGSATQDNGGTMGVPQQRNPIEGQTQRSPQTNREGYFPPSGSNVHDDESHIYSNGDDDSENSNNDDNNSSNGNNSTNPRETGTARPGASPINKQEQEMIRWFRSHPFGREIDCDFKLRHKIANGYLIGACLAYYHRGKIDKVDFNRGNGPANKVANWEFVQKFLRRRGYSLCRKDVECLCTVPMPAEKGVASAYRVLSQLYSFLLADDLVPPVAGVKAARLQPQPARPKVPIYKRFTDRRRSDLEEEMMAAIASKDGNPYSSGGEWRRSSSVPVASSRTRASFANSEEFHRSRQRYLEETVGADDYRVDEQSSEGRHRRRRSKDSGQGSIGINPALGQYGTGGQDDVGVRGRADVDQLGERRSGGRGGDGRSGVATPPYDTPREGAGKGGAGCAGCGLCNCPERTANSSRKEGRIPEVDDRVRPWGRGEGRRVAREPTGAGGGRRLGRAHAPPTSSCSSSESEGRHRKNLRRRRGSVSDDYDNDGHDPSRGYPRDGYSDGLEREASIGHRSDPSCGRGKPEYNRRQRRLRQRGGYHRDDTYRSHKGDEYYHDHRTDDRTWRGARRRRGAEGYHGEGDSSSEEDRPSARRRRAKREGVVGATFTGMCPGREHHTYFGVEKGEARHRGEHRRTSHSGFDHDGDTHGTHDGYHPDKGGCDHQSHRQAGKPGARVNVRDSYPQRQRGKDKGSSKHTREASVEAYSQPLSTPRRRVAQAVPTSPPEPSGLAWRGTRRRERGWRTENTDSSGHGYPSLPPAALPGGRRRSRDFNTSGRNHRSEETRPSRGARSAKDDLEREDWPRNRGNASKDSAGGLDDRHLGGNGRQERQGRMAAEESLGKRGNGRDCGGDGGGGGARTRPPERQHNPPGRLSPRTKKNVLPGSPHGARRRQAGGENRGTVGGGIRNRDREQAAAAATAAAADVLSKTPKQGRVRSPVSKKAPLEKMSGFGYGDRGWSERVEGRRRQQMMKRDQGAGSMAAEVDGKSGRIQPVLAPSAPPGPLVGQHQQAVSPPRLRRLVHAEGRRQPGGPNPPRDGSNLPQQTSAVPKAIMRNKIETSNASQDASGHEPGRHQDQPQRPQQIPPTRAAPKRAGFNSYADDGAAGVEVGVRWG